MKSYRRSDDGVSNFILEAGETLEVKSGTAQVTVPFGTKFTLNVPSCKHEVKPGPCTLPQGHVGRHTTEETW